MSQDDVDFVEKRDFIRMFIDSPIDFAITGTDEWFKGTGQNLCGGGLSFSTQQLLSEGDIVNIKLHPLNDLVPHLEALVIVMRVDEQEGGLYLVSTKIEKILS
ncbi:MAG: hypothetical protein GY829_12780 [Gammaproteobacteria bacterium]|nr:hypothetical protein [Gammaproteobacteria bacterium]